MATLYSLIKEIINRIKTVDAKTNVNLVESKSYTDSEIERLEQLIASSGGIESAYPVGSIYINVNNTNPADIFGFGTWEQIKDTFLLAAGDTYTNGTTGGEATHTLTIPEMPTHDHIVNAHSHAIGLDQDTPSGTYGWSLHVNTDGTSVSGAQRTVVSGSSSPGTNARGGGEAHNNMPPYLAVCVWQRTS